MVPQADPNSAPIFYSDSQGVVALLKNPVHHNTLKHIDIRYHFVEDYVTLGKLGLEKISTTDNISNEMSKSRS